ncbi:MAG: hypothetical protein NVS3B27_02170 [Novosphingobium sp.]
MSEAPSGFQFDSVHGHLDGDDGCDDFGHSEYPARNQAALNVSIFADRAYLRAELAEDAVGVGLRIAQSDEFSALLDADAKALGNVVLVDCPVIDGAELAALGRLDMRAARIGAELVVSTSMGSLDDVFGCLDQSGAQVLVSPNRAERAIALGRVMARAGGKARVRELSEADRLSLIRLTEQVGQIAQKLDQMSLRPAPAVPASEPSSASASAFDFSDDASLRPEDGSARLVRAIRPALPEPRLIRRVIRQRQLRARFFDSELFADPAWDILLDLTAARAEHLRVSVTSLCIASGVPPTTALRWIGQMTDAGLLLRVDDEADRRRAFIALSDKSADAMARYFHELGATGDNLSV